MLPADLLTRYGIPEAEAMEAIEVAVAGALTNAFRTNLAVSISGSLEITILPPHGEPVEISPAMIDRKLRRHLIHKIELELQKRQTLLEAEELKELRGKTVAGEICRAGGDGTLYVILEIADVFRRLILSGECPVRHQPPHERGRYRIGSVKEFFITSVLPVTVGGRSARVRIRLSRTSKELPALLLMEKTGIAGIECRRRVSGGFSEIVTPARLPKEAINAVGKELGEYLNVRILKAPKR